ncbi:hypothetical protein NADFUDRAFT_64813 [Nadsonia fulvescens var. elongata DSM 6958]|uniref:UBA domain-containing protein n=1 Tax=Nadsonia fulvescens var. elongata DSM 6958 TaxID=857566 RepID=A0A1E3PLQ2_9ASCO|nr:hypothetical protein NADFUDRAFT_64813 [Nadsonia fulvescens var. elongata DSM 6958]
MDNFAGLSWGNSSGNSPQTSTYSANSSKNGSHQSSSRSTPVPDSFAELVSFGPKNESKKFDSMARMTLQERQIYLLSTKAEEKKVANNQWGDFDLLMSSGSGSTSNSAVVSSVNDINIANSDKPEEEDPFAIFNQPPPKKEPPLVSSSSVAAPTKKLSHGASLLEGFDDISDAESEVESDYRREDLNHPMASNHGHSSHISPSKNDLDNSKDKAIAELVDMGFTAEQAVDALNQTRDGTDIQQAIEYMMSQAHKNSGNHIITNGDSYLDNEFAPRWKSGSPNAKQPDITKLASQFQKQFISKANVFWDMGKKNLVKAIDTYQEKSRTNDDGTPAWMKKQDNAVREEVRQRLAQERIEHGDERKRPPLEERLAHRKSENLSSVKSSNREPEPKSISSQIPSSASGFVKSLSQPNQRTTTKQNNSQNNLDLISSNRSSSGLGTSSNNGLFDSPVTPAEFLTPAQAFKAKVKQEEEIPIYISPSKRRLPAPPRSQTPSRSSMLQTPSPPTKTMTAARHPVSISPEALKMATKSREAGNDAFKLGDFDEALNHYTKALSYIPNKHLLRTLILSNRAMCNLKVGDSKSAIADAEQGIMIIGTGMGVGENVESGKSLKDIWFKLFSRKAEALEHLEKFKEALSTWNILIHNGFSNKLTLDGKRRCVNAVNRETETLSSKTSDSLPSIPRASSPISNTSFSNARPSAASIAAVNKIREQSAEAEKVDEERFLLVDLVDARLNQWKGGKEDNLRALLGSLHNILWKEAGWKQVSMADLILPKKVKVNYMKAVSKTHPDKVSNSTSTEQKMIAQGVFVALNKAWDDFKASNNIS